MINFYGREQIFTSYDEVNSSNINKVLDEVLTKHQKNVGQIKFLYDYYRGFIREKRKSAPKSAIRL